MSMDTDEARAYRIAKSKAYHAADPSRAAARKRAWRAANRHKVKAQQVNSREADRARQLARNFAALPEDYDAMLADQGGGCSVCEKPPTTRRLAIDHSHETGIIRGLLCTQCNQALGLLAEDPERIAALADYLWHNRGRPKG